MFCLPAGRAANRNKERKPIDPGPALLHRGGISAFQGVDLVQYGCSYVSDMIVIL